MWPVGLSTRLPIAGTVGRCPAVYLMGRDPIPYRLGFPDPAGAGEGVSGISAGFLALSRGRGQVGHVLLTRSPLYSRPEPS